MPKITTEIDSLVYLSDKNNSEQLYGLHLGTVQFI